MPYANNNEEMNELLARLEVAASICESEMLADEECQRYIQYLLRRSCCESAPAALRARIVNQIEVRCAHRQVNGKYVEEVVEQITRIRQEDSY